MGSIKAVLIGAGGREMYIYGDYALKHNMILNLWQLLSQTISKENDFKNYII